MWTESGHKVDTFTRQAFLGHLRDTLNHLYHADRLRQSPLAALLGVANRFDAASALQRILTEAIKSLEPAADEPSQSRAWRIYESLFCCYVQQLSQQVVADQLGISTRQLRREQHVALEALADRLWEQFRLQDKVGKEAGAEVAQAGGVQASSTINEELAWLKDTPPDRPADLDQVLPVVLDLAQPLAARHGVSLKVKAVAPLSSLAVHPVALNQALLNLLSVAVPQAAGGRVVLSARALSWEVEIEVRGDLAGTEPRSTISDNDAASLDMAHQLVELCGGRLVLSNDVKAFHALLVFPALEQLPVLVIDDNADTLQLLQRYTSGTRYRFVGTRDPEQALVLAAKLAPQIIVLDVMMPQVDGWRVLSRLRQHPLTGHIPIVVCTILAQEALAFSLGASAFIRKPVTRQAFLAVLDGQVERMATGSR